MNAIIRPNNKTIIIVVKTVLIFLFLYEFNLSSWGLPTVFTSRRIAVLAALICVVFIGRGKLVFREYMRGASYSYKKIMLLQAFLLFYSGMLIIVIGRGEGDHIFYILIRFFYMVGVGVFAFHGLFADKDEFLKCILYATMVQVGFILLFVLFPQLQAACDLFTGESLTNAGLSQRGYRTGFACSTSMGVLKMTPALGSCIYFYLKNKNSGNVYMICLLLITVSATIVARTGLLMGMIAVLVILIGSGKAKTGGAFKALSAVLIVLVVAMFIIYALNLDDLFAGAFERLIRLRDEGIYGDFFSIYFGQIEGSKTIVPPITIKTIIGTGITSGISGNGVAVNVDGGYVRMYVAVGLPLAILFYLIIIKNLIKPIRNLKNAAFMFLMIYMFIYLLLGEFKEFFINNGFAICIIFTLWFLHYKEERDIEV